MFNYTGSSNSFRNFGVLGGCTFADYETHKTIYAGVDPADPRRALIRKIVQVNKSTFCFEETRITPGEKNPIVHTQLYRVKDFDMNVKLSPQEI